MPFYKNREQQDMSQEKEEMKLIFLFSMTFISIILISFLLHALCDVCYHREIL